jgi:hypothetical protein
MGVVIVQCPGGQLESSSLLISTAVGDRPPPTSLGFGLAARG